MEITQITSIIEKVAARGDPAVEFIRKAAARSPRVGVFASSFNPPTLAHAELMRRAAASFSLGEVLALAAVSNADKSDYECGLADRLRMLELAFGHAEGFSLALSSRPYFIDMLDALRRAYGQATDLHFIVGFDTFERVLDREGKYAGRYHRRFDDRAQALDYLTAHSKMIVAGRAGAGEAEVRELLKGEPPHVAARFLYLDFPANLAERSATEVRGLIRAGGRIEGLVPRAVSRYIQERRLYK